MVAINSDLHVNERNEKKTNWGDRPIRAEEARFWGMGGRMISQSEQRRLGLLLDQEVWDYDGLDSVCFFQILVSV